MVKFGHFRQQDARGSSGETRSVATNYKLNDHTCFLLILNLFLEGETISHFEFVFHQLLLFQKMDTFLANFAGQK